MVVLCTALAAFPPFETVVAHPGSGFDGTGPALEGISDDVRTCVVSDVWCTSLEIGYIASDLQAIGLAGANLENVIRLPVSEKPRCWSA